MRPSANGAGSSGQCSPPASGGASRPGDKWHLDEVPPDDDPTGSLTPTTVSTRSAPPRPHQAGRAAVSGRGSAWAVREQALVGLGEQGVQLAHLPLPRLELAAEVRHVGLQPGDGLPGGHQLRGGRRGRRPRRRRRGSPCRRRLRREADDPHGAVRPVHVLPIESPAAQPPVRPVARLMPRARAASSRGTAGPRPAPGRPRWSITTCVIHDSAWGRTPPGMVALCSRGRRVSPAGGTLQG